MKKLFIATALSLSALAAQAKDIVDTAVAAGSSRRWPPRCRPQA
jgi:hypothetical protein